MSSTLVVVKSEHHNYGPVNINKVGGKGVSMLITPMASRCIMTNGNKNSSGDEIANVLVNDDIAHT